MHNASSRVHNELFANNDTKGKAMTSGLSDFIRKNGRDRGNYQFRLIADVKGIELSSPVYTYEQMHQVLKAHGIEANDLKKILARPAGRNEWMVF